MAWRKSKQRAKKHTQAKRVVKRIATGAKQAAQAAQEFGQAMHKLTEKEAGE